MRPETVAGPVLVPVSLAATNVGEDRLGRATARARTAAWTEVAAGPYAVMPATRRLVRMTRVGRRSTGASLYPADSQVVAPRLRPETERTPGCAAPHGVDAVGPAALEQRRSLDVRGWP